MLLALTLIAALGIFVKGLFFSLNNMSRHTSHGMRLAWVSLTTGAAGVLLSPLYGRMHSPTFWETALVVGIAMYVLFERRRPDNLRGTP